MLDALPSSRMVLLRYPIDLYNLHGKPTTATEAYSGTARARVGFYNLATASGIDDWTTFSYWGVPGYSIDQNKAFVAANARYTATGGETTRLAPPYSDCSLAVPEIASLHYSYLDWDWNPDVLNTWKTQGCYNEVADKLGYRFQLVDAKYPKSLRAGQFFNLSFRVTNTGYAAMFNARPVYAVLKSAGVSYTFALPSADPRRWYSGTTTSISASFRLPGSMIPGTYSLYLWLPDASATLQNDLRYSVRLANSGVWEDTTGFNRIASNFTVQ
jgi:hypothetical protein